MTATWILLLLALQLTPGPALRVYTGTALGHPPKESVQLPSDSKLSKRSWSPPNAQAGLYKVKLTQRGYIQFLRYLAYIPPLQQYTFCVWVTSSNFTYNHPLFSYSRQEKESLVKVWLSPSDGTLKATLKDEPILRVPVSFREGRWYHICQSWSGVTGEWVVFIDGKVKATERVHRHIGTMLPGGGDVAVGQELTDFNKGLDDGVEGEIFGFNLVDEAVDLQDSAKAQSLVHYRPEIESKSFIPHFKKLPPIRKSFEEIHSYISQLPTDLESATAGSVEGLRLGEQPAKNQPRRSKPRVQSKPGKLPIRKVVVYREERMDDGTEILRRPETSQRAQRLLKRLEPTLENVNSIPDVPRPKITQEYDVNYNMHTYRGPKERTQASGYKIYEDPEEEVYEGSQDTRTSSGGKRRARQNFDVYSLWEANRVNPFYVKPYEAQRNKYHFEREQQASRRSLTLDPSEEASEISGSGPRTRSALPDLIPVHEEVDEGFRRKRDAEEDTKRDARHIHSGTVTEFRRLPALPDSFVNLLSPSASKDDVIQKLNLFLGNNTSSGNPPTSTNSQVLQRRDPQNFPRLDEILLRHEEEEDTKSSQGLLDSPQPQSPSLPNTGSAGSDLVTRSYVLCGLERGSPTTDKRHLLVSWADTPVRIYGGAMVTNAKNVCGHF